MIPNGATFGGGAVGVSKHTYTDFNMVPKSKITFNPPAVKTEYIDVAGANGRLDYTEVLTGGVMYDNRVGTIEFVVLIPSDYPTVYSQLLAFFHGKNIRVILDDDPNYYYQGRFSVNQWKSMEGASTIAIDYNLDPYKYSIDRTGSIDWLWNDLFDNTIYYGTFNVKGTKARNLINPSSLAVTPRFVCSSLMLIDFNNVTYTLLEGETDFPGFTLAHGNNNMVFRGNGTVLVDYIMGALL